MFAPTRYLEWARLFYGKVRCDLASSGIPPVPIAELGLPEASVLDDPSGWPQLRAAIARYNDVPEREAIAALGTTHALWLAYSSLASPGDEILVERPGYEPLSRIAEGLGLRVATFDRDPAAGFALEPDRVARALSPRTKVVAVSNLHNPSGVRASSEALAAVAALAHARGAFLLVDEVYAPFDGLTDDRGEFHGSARKLAPNVVTAGSLTKCYGLGPQRIGWVLGAPEVIARAEDAITASCGMLPLPHAHAAVHAFRRIGALAARSRALVSDKRQRVGQWARAQGLQWSDPPAGLFGFARVPGAGDLRPKIEAAAEAGLVLVAPGAFFGVPDGFRIAWSRPAAILEEGLTHLTALLSGVMGEAGAAGAAR